MMRVSLLAEEQRRSQPERLWHIQQRHPALTVGASRQQQIRPRHPGLLLAVVLLAGIVAGCAPRASRPLTVWAADERQEVYPTSRGPDPRDVVYDAAKGAVSLRAAINETASFQVALHSGILPVTGVNLKVSDLRNERGEALRAEVKVFRAWPVELQAFRAWQRLYRQDNCTPRRVFDVLVPAETKGTGLPAEMPPGAMILTWIDIHIAKGSEPGTYGGAVRITSAGQPLWTLNLTLVVEPFALSDAPALPAMTRFDARQLCRLHLRLAGRPYAPIRLTPENPLAKEATQLIHATARLLNEHGITGIPVGYEPAMHIDGDGQVRIEWEDYDQLMQPLIDGSAFEGRIRPTAWPQPMDGDHPPLPRSGSVSQATYQGLLRQVAEQSAEHFRLRRWYKQSYTEIAGEGAWPDAYTKWEQMIVPTVKQADARGRLLLRLPREEMSAYGWFGWPATRKLTRSAGILSVPARCFLYQDDEKAPEKTQHWLRPDFPPFSPSLCLGGSAVDPGAVAWATWRLKADALDLPDQKGWPESSHIAIDRTDSGSDGWLFWPGTAWGSSEPVPSIRLKRLRMGLQECKYLYLLRQHGRIHVDEMLAESLVPLAGSLAYGRQYIEGLDGEVQLDKGLWDAGVRLMAEELKMAIAGAGSDEFVRFTNRIDWQTFLGKTRQVKARAEPVRLAAGADGVIRATVPVEILNLKAEPVAGTLRWGLLPELWKPSQEKVSFGPILPFQRTRVVLTCEGPGLGTDAAGHADWNMVLEPQEAQAIEIPVVLSAVAAMQLQRPVQIDGDLTDWRPGRFNMLSGFAPLGRRDEAAASSARPDLQRTDAFVATDGQYLYIAVRMQDQAPQMHVSQRNTVAYDGSIPAGEDLVEILIDPDNGASGGPERLVHIIVKANGAALASQGVDMQPPLCKPRPLGTQVQAATRIYPDAWTAEVAIPLDVVKAVRPAAAYWGLNICRLRSGNLEYSSWSGTRISSYHPDSLGNLLIPVR